MERIKGNEFGGFIINLSITNMTIKQITLVFALSLLFASCEVEEVIETKCSNVNLVDNRFVYQNDSIAIYYNFWKRGGQMNFEIFNKTNIPMYVDWENSAYILNDQKFAYWKDENVTSNSSIYLGFGVAVGNGVSFHPERVTLIPPRAAITKVSFVLERNKLPVTVNQARSGEMFTEENSPLRFRNYIAYFFDKQGAMKAVADNEFYIADAFLVKESHLKDSKSPQRFFQATYH